jgi:hypothetical protein
VRTEKLQRSGVTLLLDTAQQFFGLFSEMFEVWFNG